MPVSSPTNAYINAQRYGAILVLARFTVFQKGIQVGAPFLANVSTGTFTIDRNAEFRRTGQITIETIPSVPPPPLMPVNPESLLAPFGTEIFVETGIAAAGILENPDQATEVQWVPAGLYAVATTQVNDSSVDLTATLDLYDRAWTIAQRTLKNPYNFPATGSGNFVAEIKALIDMVWNEQSGVAPITYNIVPTSAVVPVASYNQGSDPWQAALDMAAAVGYELYFGYQGMLNGHPIPNPQTTQVAWNYTDDETAILGLGGTGSTALGGSAFSSPSDASVKMTRDGIFNDIVIQGTGDANAATYNGNGIQTSSPPILAEASDQNPNSPTYVGGGLGDVPSFISSSLVTAVSAQPMASDQLNVSLSSAWTATIAAPPNPILNVDDVITVTRPRIGLNAAKIVIDVITHTFNYADLMLITGRVISNQPS